MAIIMTDSEMAQRIAQAILDKYSVKELLLFNDRSGSDLYCVSKEDLASLISQTIADNKEQATP